MRDSSAHILSQYSCTLQFKPLDYWYGMQFLFLSMMVRFKSIFFNRSLSYGMQFLFLSMMVRFKSIFFNRSLSNVKISYLTSNYLINEFRISLSFGKHLHNFVLLYIANLSHHFFTKSAKTDNTDHFTLIIFPVIIYKFLVFQLISRSTKSVLAPF